MPKGMVSWKCGVGLVENCLQPSSGCVTVLETPQALVVVRPKSRMRIFAFPQITNAAVSHYTRMNMAHWDPQKTLCFFILPVSGGFKHQFERLQLAKCNGCSFLLICFDGKYTKSSQKLLMMQYQVSNPSCMFLVGNFNSMEFLERENHPVELLMHKLGSCKHFTIHTFHLLSH